ncbi:hypothetical protein ABPG74_002726 [Tetrahymena malaccensis]
MMKQNINRYKDLKDLLDSSISQLTNIEIDLRDNYFESQGSYDLILGLVNCVNISTLKLNLGCKYKNQQLESILKSKILKLQNLVQKAISS